MNSSEARARLSVSRAGEIPEDDPAFAEAQREAEADPALMLWWTAEQELDESIGAKLRSVHVPACVRESLTLSEGARINQWQRSSWSRRLLAAAAAVIALAVLFGSWRGPFQPRASLADYRDEMVGFIKVAPSLELQTSQLERIKDWLANSSAPSAFPISNKLAALEPLGCRTLRYRGHDVSLICFKRAGKLLHLMVMDQAGLPNLPERENPTFAAEGEWMTALWKENGKAYLLMLQSDREQLAKYIFDA